MTLHEDSFPIRPSENGQSSETDEELVRSALAGQESAFNTLFERHYEAVRGLAIRILLDLTVAEDIAQETFVRAARSLGSLSDPAGLRSWLFRVAVNLCRDHQRSAARRIAREQNYAELCQPECKREHPLAPRIATALAKLPPAHREAIVLVFYENLPHAEAARVAGCAVSTLSWRVMLAKRTLKKLLAK